MQPQLAVAQHQPVETTPVRQYEDIARTALREATNYQRTAERLSADGFPTAALIMWRRCDLALAMHKSAVALMQSHLASGQ
jgi:hypothetical protein